MSTNVFIRWWRRLTLHTRLSLLVTGAVAAAVLTVAVLAFTAVREIQQHQIESELTSAARAIAAEPEQWVGIGPTPPDNGFDNRRGNGYRRPRDLGSRWQILDNTGSVVSQSNSALPVTGAALEIAAGQQPPT